MILAMSELQVIKTEEKFGTTNKEESSDRDEESGLNNGKVLRGETSSLLAESCKSNEKENNVDYGTSFVKTKEEKTIDAKSSLTDETCYHEPRRTACHLSFILLELLTVIACALVALVQMFPHGNKTDVFSGFFHFLLRTSIFFVSLLFILVELDFSLTMNTVPLLENWIVRGFFYMLVGTIVGLLQSAYNVQTVSEYVEGESNGWREFGVMISSSLVKLAGLSLSFSGLLYFLLGLFCMKKMKEKLNEAYERKCERLAAVYPDNEVV